MALFRALMPIARLTMLVALTQRVIPTFRLHSRVSIRTRMVRYGRAFWQHRSWHGCIEEQLSKLEISCLGSIRAVSDDPTLRARGELAKPSRPHEGGVPSPNGVRIFIFNCETYLTSARLEILEGESEEASNRALRGERPHTFIQHRGWQTWEGLGAVINS